MAWPIGSSLTTTCQGLALEMDAKRQKFMGKWIGEGWEESQVGKHITQNISLFILFLLRFVIGSLFGDTKQLKIQNTAQ